MGASSRAGVHLYAAAKATATLSGRRVVTADDVKKVARYVLLHRLEADDPERVLNDALSAAFDANASHDRI